MINIFQKLTVSHGVSVFHAALKGSRHVSHGLLEHIAFGFILAKAAYYMGTQEAHLVDVLAQYFVPVGMVAAIGYLVWRALNHGHIQSAGNHVKRRHGHM